MRYTLTYAALVGAASAWYTVVPSSSSPTTTPGKTCAPGLVEGATGCVLPPTTTPTPTPTPTPKPPFPWTFKDKCLEKCVSLGPWTDAHMLCAPGAYVSLYQCRGKYCHDDWKYFAEEYSEICNAPSSSSSSTTPCSSTETPSSTSTPCSSTETPSSTSTPCSTTETPSSTSTPCSTTPTPTPSTTKPPYPCGTKCHPHTHPTAVTITTTTIETLTYCPHRHTCHGQTTTWTHTEGPTSCAPTVTCTCVLPGYPTLTTCPPSVTCTGQTTTITEGSTVVLPTESLPTRVPAGPTTSSVVEFQGAAATAGAGILAVVAGVVAVL